MTHYLERATRQAEQQYLAEVYATEPLSEPGGDTHISLLSGSKRGLEGSDSGSIATPGSLSGWPPCCPGLRSHTYASSRDDLTIENEMRCPHGLLLDAPHRDDEHKTPRGIG